MAIPEHTFSMTITPGYESLHRNNEIYDDSVCEDSTNLMPHSHYGHGPPGAPFFHYRRLSRMLSRKSKGLYSPKLIFDGTDEPSRFHIKECVRHHFRRLCAIFQSGASLEYSIPRTSHQDHKPCLQPIPAFKEQAKALLTRTVLLSLGTSAAAILISNTDVPALPIFILNLIAIVPLSVTLAHATESISQDFGETMGALLNISTGNLAELAILSVFPAPHSFCALTTS